MPFCPCDGRWVSLGDLSAGLRYTTGDPRERGMVLAMAALGVEHHHGAPLEPLAPALALKIIQALHPAPHPGTQQDRGGGIEGGAKHRRVCEDDVARYH